MRFSFVFANRLLCRCNLFFNIQIRRCITPLQAPCILRSLTFCEANRADVTLYTVSTSSEGTRFESRPELYYRDWEGDGFLQIPHSNFLSFFFFKSDHDRFLPDTSQFIIYLSSFPSFGSVQSELLTASIKITKYALICEISGFLRGVLEAVALLGCYAV